MLRLLGNPGLFKDETPVDLSPRAILLYAFLALARANGRPRATAATQFFADCPEPAARRRLNTALWRLKAEMRARTGVDLQLRQGIRSIGLDTDADAVVVDVSMFEGLVQPVLRRGAASLTPADTERLVRAVDMHRGSLIESCDDDWVLAERYRIDSLYLTSLDFLIQHFGIRGEIDAITRYGQLALSVEPLREDVHRHLMKAYADVGRTDLAESQFEKCRLLLRQELDTDPMPETVALRLQIVRGKACDHLHFAALVTELERARADVTSLAASVDRALDRLRNLS